MIKHYILNLNPESQSEWDRYIMRNPITGERPDLTAEIARAVGDTKGSYLIKVNLEVEILEQTSVKQSNNNTLELTTIPERAKLAS